MMYPCAGIGPWRLLVAMGTIRAQRQITVPPGTPPPDADAEEMEPEEAFRAAEAAAEEARERRAVTVLPVSMAAEPSSTIEMVLEIKSIGTFK